MSKIIGVTVGTTLPKPNFDQTDPRKGDYIRGDRAFITPDETLTHAGRPADAKAVGDALATKQPIGDYAKTTDLSDYATKDELPTKVSDLTNDAGYLTSYTETDPTVPSWAKASSKPTYTKSEVGLGNVDNVKQYSANNPPPYPVTSVNGSTGAITIKAVPACSTSNNGQFLRVVNGAATWSTVPNAEEASF